MICCLSLFIVSAGFFPPGGPPRAPVSPCRCEELRLRNGWCRACEHGFVGGVRIDSYLLFDTLDAHGHNIAFEGLRCDGCRTAYETDGFCKTCKWGFVDRKLYFSRLTYSLARGQVQRDETITCEPCRAHARAAGWCAKCDVGRVGPFSYRKRADFDRAHQEYQRLLQALEVAKRCEYCAAVMFTGVECPVCSKKTPKNVPSP